MNPIHPIRKQVEQRKHRHFIRRGWRGVLHYENLPILDKIITFLLHITFLHKRGTRNAVSLAVENVEVALPNLPESFDGTRILYLSDLHLDSLAGLEDRILRYARKLDYDYCVLGGDFVWGHDRLPKDTEKRIETMARELTQTHPVYAVLGNHDIYRVAETLERCGVHVLLNEGVWLERGSERVYLAGVDDCHYFGSDDFDAADAQSQNGAFKIMLCHSPERYQEAAQRGYDLFLAGHTHGGQVCLPGGHALVTCTTAPRKMIKGLWKHGNMQGYTCRGAGVSGPPYRFFCPPEISLFTLKSP